MIDPQTKNLFTETLGHGFLQKLADFAQERELKNRKGEYYTVHTFSKVLNGDRNMPKIEDIIVDCVDHYRQENEKREKRKAELAKKLQVA